MRAFSVDTEVNISSCFVEYLSLSFQASTTTSPSLAISFYKTAFRDIYSSNSVLTLDLAAIDSIDTYFSLAFSALSSAISFFSFLSSLKAISFYSLAVLISSVFLSFSLTNYLNISGSIAESYFNSTIALFISIQCNFVSSSLGL